MIRTSHLVHKSLVNMNAEDSTTLSVSSLGDTMFGNKIALLSGDYLLGNCCAELAGLRFYLFFKITYTYSNIFLRFSFIEIKNSMN